MKRKGLIVLAATAVLAVHVSNVDAYAGWEKSASGNNWVFADESGNKVTNTWKKGEDNNWRYLNSSGEMALNSWVENTYYVDSNGILVTDKWMKFQDNGSADYKWYYFGSSGKAIMDNWSKINNKWYYFDANGEMQTGWVLDDMYYTGTDGAMRTGWQKLYPPSSNGDSGRINPGDSDDGKSWYYFGENGKKYVPKDVSGDFGSYKINGEAYCFDTDGSLQTGWKNVGINNAEHEIENYKYFDNNGKMRKAGWLSVEPPKDINGYEENVEWFYFSTAGVPKSGPKEGDASTQNLTKINDKTYLFNDLGNPVFGLQKVSIGGSSDYTAFYFGDKKVSTMQKGKVKVIEGDGNDATYYFSDSGRGYTGVKDGYLYYMGKLQCADSGNKYEPIAIPTGSTKTTYVVNSSGKVSKNTTVKSADGVKYKTGSNGNLIKVDEENPSGNEGKAPAEPTWQ